jgi:hypothetical protein
MVGEGEIWAALRGKAGGTFLFQLPPPLAHTENSLFPLLTPAAVEVAQICTPSPYPLLALEEELKFLVCSSRPASSCATKMEVDLLLLQLRLLCIIWLGGVSDNILLSSLA